MRFSRLAGLNNSDRLVSISEELLHVKTRNGSCADLGSIDVEAAIPYDIYSLIKIRFTTSFDSLKYLTSNDNAKFEMGDAGGELRRRVLALVRASRPATGARHSGLPSALARLSAACGALADAALTASESDSCSTDGLASEEQRFREELERLAALMTRESSAAKMALPILVADRLKAGPDPFQRVEGLSRRASRKRTRAEMKASREGEDAAEINAPPALWTVSLPTRLCIALADLLLVLALHGEALVRLDALLASMRGDIAGMCDTIRLVLDADPAALPTFCQRIIRVEAAVSIRSSCSKGDSDSRACDSHAMAESLVIHLAQLAFPIAVNQEPFDREDSKRRLSRRTALSALESICSLSWSLPLPQQIRSLRVVFDALPGNSQSAAPNPRLGDEAVDDFRGTAKGEKIAFLSDNLLSFLWVAARNRLEMANCSRVIAAAIRVLPPPAVIQVIRRFLTHDPDLRENLLAVDDDHATRNTSSHTRSVQGAVFELIRRCESADVTFVGLALALAHELADDAVLGEKPWLFGRALELAAAVSSSPQASPRCYKDWFQDHFRNYASGNIADTKIGDDVWRCAKYSRSEAADSCRLIRSENHLQFVCLCLLELDRCDDGNCNKGTNSPIDHVIWTSTHVLTHLSVLKSFQGSNSPESTLVVDFCAESRICYTRKLSREQENPKRSSEDCSPSVLVSESARATKYSNEARAVVDSSVEYYKKHGSLSPQLKQWKTFQYLKWKSDILPCCLDISMDARGANRDADDADSDQHNDVDAQIDLVLALAKADMVPADDYARFLGKVQSWVDKTRATIVHKSQQKRQQVFTRNLRHSIKKLRRICHWPTVMESKACTTRPSECLARVSECVEAYFNAHAAHPEGDNATEENSRQRRALLLWASVFVEVLKAISFDRLDVFYGFQISLLVKIILAEDKRLALNSDGSSFMRELSTIALSQRTSVSANSIEWAACFGGVVAGMFVATKEHSIPAIPVDILNEFSVVNSAMNTCEWAGRQRFESKALLFTCFLRALTVLQTILPHMNIRMACFRAFPAHEVDLWAWISYRVWRESQCMPLIRAVTDTGDASCQIGVRVCQGQHSLLQTEWVETFRQRWKLVETVKNMLDYEFRCGDALKSILDAVLCDEEAGWMPASTLCLHLEIVDSVGIRQPPVQWCEWLIDEILSLASAQPLKSNAEAKPIVNEGLPAALLLLNELIRRSHRDSDQDSDFRRRLVSQWLEQTLRTLQAVDEKAVALKQRLYRCSSELLSVIRSGEASFPPLQREKSHHLMELMRVAALDLSHEDVSVSVRRFLLRPLRELTLHRRNGSEWKTEDIAAMPIELLVEWGRLQTDDDSKLQGGIQDRHLLTVIEWLRRTIATVNSVGFEEIPDNRTPAFLANCGHFGSPIPVSSIFASASEAAKFLIRAAGFALGSSSNRAVAASDGIRDPQLPIRLHRMAGAVLNFCSDSSWGVRASATVAQYRAPHSGSRYDGDVGYVLVSWLFERWGDHKIRVRPRGNLLLFHLFLLHVTAVLCARSTLASSKLLELPTSHRALRAVFAVLVASVAVDSGQLDAILVTNSSLWVNAFPEVATAAICHRFPGYNVKALPATAASYEEVLGGTAAFRSRTAALVQLVLTYAVEHRVELLTASLKERIIAQWPQFESLVSQLPVLSLDTNMKL